MREKKGEGRGRKMEEEEVYGEGEKEGKERTYLVQASFNLLHPRDTHSWEYTEEKLSEFLRGMEQREKYHVMKKFKNLAPVRALEESLVFNGQQEV
jgi:hypothetical protein